MRQTVIYTWIRGWQRQQSCRGAVGLGLCYMSGHTQNTLHLKRFGCSLAPTASFSHLRKLTVWLSYRVLPAGIEHQRNLKLHTPTSWVWTREGLQNKYFVTCITFGCSDLKANWVNTQLCNWVCIYMSVCGWLGVGVCNTVILKFKWVFKAKNCFLFFIVGLGMCNVKEGPLKWTMKYMCVLVKPCTASWISRSSPHRNNIITWVSEYMHEGYVSMSFLGINWGKQC